MPTAPIPDNDASRLETLDSYSILDSLPEREYEDITALASYICETPISLISLIDKNRQWFKSAHGVKVEETDRAESFCAYTLTRTETLVVEDALRDARFLDNPLVIGSPGIRFYAGAPLIAPNGHVLGTICVLDTKPKQLSPAQIAALESLSRQAMSLMESRRRLMINERTTEVLLRTEKLAAIGRLASSMAHEINNPLEAVTNLLYLARMKAQNSDVIDWLDQADMELRRVSTIASQALRFHRQASNPQPVSCTNLFLSTLDLNAARIKNFNITVEKRKRADEPVVCFEGDVRQVLHNVISNAIDAMPKGGRLLVRSRGGTDWETGRKGLVLTIADSGTGMDSATQRKIFDAFYTTKGIGGSGLGLWISADIMHRHHGKIIIRSSQKTSNSGTVVVLFIPYEKPSERGACETTASVGNY
jgi:two-component system NtrC family sensor kinase